MLEYDLAVKIITLLKIVFTDKSHENAHSPDNYRDFQRCDAFG